MNLVLTLLSTYFNEFYISYTFLKFDEQSAISKSTGANASFESNFVGLSNENIRQSRIKAPLIPNDILPQKQLDSELTLFEVHQLKN